MSCIIKKGPQLASNNHKSNPNPLPNKIYFDSVKKSKYGLKPEFHNALSAPICDISVTPVVEDAAARESIRTKPYYSGGSSDASSSTGNAESSQSSQSSQ